MLPRRRAVANRGRVVDLCEGQARAGAPATGLVPDPRRTHAGQALALGRYLARGPAACALRADRCDRVEWRAWPDLGLWPGVCGIQFIAGCWRHHRAHRPSGHPFRFRGELEGNGRDADRHTGRTQPALPRSRQRHRRCPDRPDPPGRRQGGTHSRDLLPVRRPVLRRPFAVPGQSDSCSFGSPSLHR